MGMHRVWKAYTVAVAAVQPGMKVLDIAGGTGDLARAFAARAGALGHVVLTDINESMLRVGRDRLLDEGQVIATAACDAEHLPFADGVFDLASVAFGLRNMTHKEAALTEMCRVLRPGGRLLVLEFSKPAAPLQKPYDWYSFTLMPLAGQADRQGRRQLPLPGRKHPHAPGPGRAEGHDAGQRLRPCRRAQPRRRHRRAARRHQVLNRLRRLRPSV